MPKFRNTYRIESARRPGWDYRTPGAYFITICTHQRYHFFGTCTDGAMTLSPIGEIIHRFWYDIPQYSANVELGAFVVMPNHIHGILILTDWPDANSSDAKKTDHDAMTRRDDGMGRDATTRRDDGMGRDVETRQCHVSTPRHGNPDGAGQIPRNPSTHDGRFPRHGNPNGTGQIPRNPSTHDGRSPRHGNPDGAGQIPRNPSTHDGRFPRHGNPDGDGPSLEDTQTDRRTIPGFYRQIVPKSRSISTIIGSYKSACTRHINQMFPEAGFRWQERFHDHIIRNERSFDRITQYILNNPQNWEKDCFGP